jgi:hypothetical protein
MNGTLLHSKPPIAGPIYDKSRPETKQAWLDFRRPGLTATQVRDWGDGSKRREILTEKATGEFKDLSHVQAVNHGNLREPMIAAWIEARFGIAPCDGVFAHPDNLRHIASPDGVMLDPYTGEYHPGTGDAVLAEIKTSKYDLAPGRMDAERVLLSIAPGSKFDRMGYYIQMQWQMYVMGAVRTLFAWEQHDGKIDPETGTYSPIGPPQYAWVDRDEILIARLVNDLAPVALAEIDAVMRTTMPAVSALLPEQSTLVHDYLQALDDEKIAAAKKAQAWKALQAEFVSDEDHERPDKSIDLGWARVTVSTTTKPKRTIDVEAMRAKAPSLVSKYEALVERFTNTTEESKQSLTITRPKSKGDQE